jgi:hypothetical protein
VMDGTARSVSAIACQNYYMPMPDGWSVAKYSPGMMSNMSYNPNTASQGWKWGTNYVVFSNGYSYTTNNGAYQAQNQLVQTAAGHASVADYTEEEFKVQGCNRKVMIRAPISAGAFACPAGYYGTSGGAASCTRCPSGYYQSGEAQGACTECSAGHYCPVAEVMDNYQEYNGYRYAVMDGTSKAMTVIGCQNTYLPMPDGWSVAKYSSDLITNVVDDPAANAGGYKWGTYYLVLSNGYSYNTASGAEYTANQLVESADDGYKVAACNKKVMIRAPADDGAAAIACPAVSARWICVLLCSFATCSCS